MKTECCISLVPSCVIVFSREIQGLSRGLRACPGCTLPAKCCEKPIWESEDEGTHSQASLQVLFWYCEVEILLTALVVSPLFPLDDSLCFFWSSDCIIKHTIKSLYHNVHKVQRGEMLHSLRVSPSAPQTPSSSESHFSSLKKSLPLFFIIDHQNQSDNTDSFK